jgi:hypothetical protein
MTCQYPKESDIHSQNNARWAIATSFTYPSARSRHTRGGGMTDDSRTRAIVHLVFEAAKGKRKAQAQLDRLSTDPDTMQIVERCRAAALKVMTPRVPKPRPKKLGESAPRYSRSTVIKVSPPSIVRVPRSSEMRSGERARQCYVCGAPAIPGDSVCYRHGE